MIYYYKFCCKIRIADADSDDIPGTELLATEKGSVDHARERFADARMNPWSEWFEETPALRAHILALKIKHHTVETGNPGERMISTASAVGYTGRARQVLYRWEREGRISRYGTRSEALWDVFELPPVRRDGSFPPPPPKKS